MNLSQFLATAKDDATWGDAIQWRTFSHDCIMGWMSVSGELTPGDLYAFTVTAPSDSTQEPEASVREELLQLEAERDRLLAALTADEQQWDRDKELGLTAAVLRTIQQDLK